MTFDAAGRWCEFPARDERVGDSSENGKVCFGLAVEMKSHENEMLPVLISIVPVSVFMKRPA